MEDQTFWQEYEDVIGAAITLAITFIVAYIVDRFVLARRRQGRRPRHRDRCLARGEDAPSRSSAG